MMKRKRVGTGTSVKSPRLVPEVKRTKAVTGFSRKGTSPTKIFDASAPGGIFLIKWVLPYKLIKTHKFLVSNHINIQKYKFYSIFNTI